MEGNSLFEAPGTGAGTITGLKGRNSLGGEIRAWLIGGQIGELVQHMGPGIGGGGKSPTPGKGKTPGALKWLAREIAEGGNQGVLGAW